MLVDSEQLKKCIANIQKQNYLNVEVVRMGKTCWLSIFKQKYRTFFIKKDRFSPQAKESCGNIFNLTVIH